MTPTPSPARPNNAFDQNGEVILPKATPSPAPESPELLPSQCPHCGSAKCGDLDETGFHQIECYDCGSRGPVKMSESEAIAAWNQRVPVPTREWMQSAAKEIQHLDPKGDYPCVESIRPVVAIIARHAPDTAKLEAECANWRQHWRDDRAKIERMESDLAQLSKDAERLDWLAQFLHFHPLHGPPEATMYGVMVNEQLMAQLRVRAPINKGATLREAIDAARKALERVYDPMSPELREWAKAHGLPVRSITTEDARIK